MKSLTPCAKRFTSSVLYRLLEQAQIRRIRLHALRHTYSTRLVSNNESLAYVRDQIGHSSIQVTVDLYSHYVSDSNRQAVNRLDELVEKVEIETKSATSRNQDSAEVFDTPKSLINGAGEWNRTTDLRFTKPLLCQLSYAGQAGKAQYYSDGETPVNARKVLPSSPSLKIEDAHSTLQT